MATKKRQLKDLEERIRDLERENSNLAKRLAVSEENVKKLEEDVIGWKKRCERYRLALQEIKSRANIASDFPHDIGI